MCFRYACPCPPFFFDLLATDLREGILDPLPLLRGQDGVPSSGKGRAKLINPLLLVTERKGTEYSLHYGAFPLDAFNTDGACSPPVIGNDLLAMSGFFSGSGFAVEFGDAGMYCAHLNEAK